MTDHVNKLGTLYNHVRNVIATNTDNDVHPIQMEALELLQHSVRQQLTEHLCEQYRQQFLEELEKKRAK
jgi:hypothetical protein